MSICSSQISHWAGIWSLFEHLRACSSLWFDGLDNYFHCQVWVRWPTPPPPKYRTVIGGDVDLQLLFKIQKHRTLLR